MKPVLVGPSGDAEALRWRRVLVDHQEQPLFALVLHQLAEPEPTTGRDRVELLIAMHPSRRRAGGEDEKEKDDRCVSQQ